MHYLELLYRLFERIDLACSKYLDLGDDAPLALLVRNFWLTITKQYPIFRIYGKQSLFKFLNLLDRDIEIVIRPHTDPHQEAGIRVS